MKHDAELYWCSGGCTNANTVFGRTTKLGCGDESMLDDPLEVQSECVLGTASVTTRVITNVTTNGLYRCVYMFGYICDWKYWIIIRAVVD